MTSASSASSPGDPIYIVGPGSKIFDALDWPLPFAPVSGRIETLREMPAFLPGSTIILFADPPTIDDALAMMTAVVGSAPADGDAHIVFISSISALFGQSDVFPESGGYSRKKQALEQFLGASFPAGSACIVRLGNVFDCGGWADIVAHCRVALLPRGFDRCAVSGLASIRARLVDVVNDREAGVINLWAERPVTDFFARTRHVAGLGILYRNRFGRIAIKVAARLFRKAGIYLPSPDDINSFNTRLLRKIAA